MGSYIKQVDIKSCLASALMLTAHIFASDNNIALLMGTYYKEELQEQGANNFCNCAYLSCLMALGFLIPHGNCVVRFHVRTGYSINVITKKNLLKIRPKGAFNTAE